VSQHYLIPEIVPGFFFASTLILITPQIKDPRKIPDLLGMSDNTPIYSPGKTGLIHLS